MALEENTDLTIFERSVCDCRLCKIPCHTMPGFLVPGDIERIAAHIGVSLSDASPEAAAKGLAFITSNFAASEGGTVGVPQDGNVLPLRVPLIVPAQRDDGTCVFFRYGRCTIHSVAPFGCGQFDTCHGWPDHDLDKMASAILTCFADDEYEEVCTHLRTSGFLSPTLQDRRHAMLTMLATPQEH